MRIFAASSNVALPSESVELRLEAEQATDRRCQAAGDAISCCPGTLIELVQGGHLSAKERVEAAFLLGRLGVVVEDAQEQLRMPDVQLLVATGLDEVWSAFAQADIDPPKP